MSGDTGPTVSARWIVDGNNVMGVRPDGWWNDREAAAARLAQRIAEWCRHHDDAVVVVFDQPADDRVTRLAGGNLAIEVASRRGRDAADHRIVELVDLLDREERAATTVVTSDRGLRARLPDDVRIAGAGSFRSMIDDRHRPG